MPKCRLYLQYQQQQQRLTFPLFFRWDTIVNKNFFFFVVCDFSSFRDSESGGQNPSSFALAKLFIRLSGKKTPFSAHHSCRGLMASQVSSSPAELAGWQAGWLTGCCCSKVSPTMTLLPPAASKGKVDARAIQLAV